MNFIRKAALVIAASLFSITLFWFVILVGLQRTIGSAGGLKQALADSGIYKSIVSDILTQAQKEQDKQPGQSEMDIPLSDTKVRAIINDAFPPEYLQTNVEKTLDSAYAWLQGDTPKLTFSIDLQDAKVRLADGLAAYVKDKAATLPPCTAADISQNGEDFDVFNATCLPPGTDANAVAEKARSQILQGEFLKDTHFSADSIKNDKGQTLDEQLKQVPSTYQQIEQGLYAMGVLTLLFGVFVVTLSASWRAGVRKIAVIAIVIGLTEAVLGWATSAGLGAIASNPDFKEPLQHSMIKVIQNLAGDARTWWVGLGLTLTILGVAALVTLRLTRPQQSEGQGDTVKQPAQDDTIDTKPEPAEVSGDKSTEQKSKKKSGDKKLVQ